MSINYDHFDVEFSQEGAFEVDFGYVVPQNVYRGEYTVTPSSETIVLQTDNMVMENDITINPIPSNYGLITWDGSTLTVS
jgi:hypothetical protein